MLDAIPNTEEGKTAFNARAKASMREYLRSRTWEQKVESIERMNEASKEAREAMREAMSRIVSDPVNDPQP